MKPIRRHLSYANIVATLALLFAMSGGALAAKHYLINSTKQINPKVLKKLKVPGKTGATGPRGVGAAGPPGATGAEGAKGPAGQSALSPLPSGQSESGDYALRNGNEKETEEVTIAVTFPIKLAAPIPFDKTIWTPPGTAPPHCSGPGHADPGYLCVYSEVNSIPGGPEIKNGDAVNQEGTGRSGFYLEWPFTPARGIDIGTYTVTAP